MPLDDFFRRPEALSRFRMLPLGPEIEGFSEWLCSQGFCRNGIRQRVWQVSHFNQYLLRQGFKDSQEIEEELADQFIRKHLPRCRCGGKPIRKHTGVARSVHAFLNYLRGRGLLAPCSQQPRAYQEILDEFLEYLKCKRGLSENTIHSHRRFVILLLEDLGADADRERLCKLTPEQVLSFFKKHTKNAGKTNSRLIQGTLRTFLDFCLQKGYLKRDLAKAVPQIRTYKLSALPRGISDEDAKKVLASIDRTKPVGMRDFAIIQLLFTYGVRGGQIRALRLDDIQWRQNQIRFPATKGGKQVTQPLTDEVGEALLEYLRHGRPKATCGEVFLTARAPIHPITNPSTISVLVANRMRKAGVNGSPKGSHMFRHAFATRLLNRGQSLKTIADMLGHQLINTTFIYTKVDLETLRQLPLQWPEVSS